MNLIKTKIMVVWRTYDEWIEAGLDPKDFIIGKI